MNSLRRVLCFLMAMTLAAIAFPSLAAPQYTKQYSLTLTSSPSTPLTVVAHLTNQALSPGNSNIGSFKLTFTGATINPSLGSVTTNPPVPAANITVTGGSVFVLLPTPLKAQKTIDVTILLKDCGDGITIEDTGVQVWTGNMGQNFSPTLTTFPLTTSVVCGVLACGDIKVVPDSFNPGSVTVTRGDYDKNGDIAACAGLPYTYTSYDDNTLHFAWPDTITGNPHAAFDLVVYAAGSSIPGAGVTGVAWLNQDGSPVTNDPKFISGSDVGIPTALDCLTQDLPAPYGTLDTAIVATDTSLTINGVAAIPGASFPIVIINSDDPTKTERMTAVYPEMGFTGTGPFNVTYTVTRGTATEGAVPADKAPHAASALVMSTPLPILPAVLPGTVSPPYVASTQVQMCIADQTPGTGTHSTTFISIGDPWGSQP